MKRNQGKYINLTEYKLSKATRDNILAIMKQKHQQYRQQIIDDKNSIKDNENYLKYMLNNKIYQITVELFSKLKFKITMFERIQQQQIDDKIDAVVTKLQSINREQVPHSAERTIYSILYSTLIPLSIEGLDEIQLSVITKNQNDIINHIINKFKSKQITIKNAQQSIIQQQNYVIETFTNNKIYQLTEPQEKSIIREIQIGYSRILNFLLRIYLDNPDEQWCNDENRINNDYYTKNNIYKLVPRFLHKNKNKMKINDSNSLDNFMLEQPDDEQSQSNQSEETIIPTDDINYTSNDFQ
jgi:hypothetical protein